MVCGKIRQKNYLLVSLLVFLLLSITNTSAQNLVTNGDFESGLTNWTGFGSIDKNAPYMGSNCILLDDNSSSNDIVVQINNFIPVTKGQVYNFSLWYKTVTEGQKVLATVNQYNSSYQSIPFKNIDIELLGANKWRQFKTEIRNFEPNAAFIKISLRPTTWSDNLTTIGKAWFDEVNFSVSNSVNTVSQGAWVYKTTGKSTSIWFSPSAVKIYPAMSPATNTIGAVSIEGAANEEESFQLIIKTANNNNKINSISFSTFTNAASASTTLPASIFSVREVAYVNVTQPTDFSSRIGWTPDPLPNVALPLSIANTSQGNRTQTPVWVTVKIPSNAKAGIYNGKVTVNSSIDGPIDLPIKLQVFGFVLPSIPTFRTSYGLDLASMAVYHKVGSNISSRRKVFRNYLQSFSSYKIAPQDILGDDQIPVSIANSSGSKVLVWKGGVYNAVSQSVRVVDTSTTSSIAATSSPFSIDRTKTYILSFKAKASSAGVFEIVVGQLSSKDIWISGSNKELFFTASNTNSTTYSTTISSFNLSTTRLKLSLLAARWTEIGENTGTVEFDDITVTEQGSSTPLISENFQGSSNLNVTVSTADADFVSACSYALGTIGFNSFRLNLPEFADGFGTMCNKPLIGGNIWGSAGYNSIFKKILLAEDNYFNSKGWLERAYAYWYDEPVVASYSDVVTGMKILDTTDSRLKRLLTVNNDKDTVLNRKANIWVPLLNNYDSQWANQRTIEGGDSWWYVCCGPKAPYTTNFIDHPGIEHRLRYWLAWKNNVIGDLYWSVNYYRSHLTASDSANNDPWTNPGSVNSSNTADFWGNGDGRLFYPPRNWLKSTSPLVDSLPVPSQRIALIRDGIDDYEYFTILKRLALKLEELKWYSFDDLNAVAAAKSLIDIPANIMTSLIGYTDDCSQLNNYRKNVALTIDNIQSRLNTSLPSSQDIPSGWSVLFENPDPYSKVAFRVTPLTTIGIRNEKPGQWYLDMKEYGVTPGETWTFTAITYGRDIGSFIANGFAGMSIVALNSSGQIINSELGTSIVQKGNFNWTKQSITVTVPSGVSYLRPRFHGLGSGEYYVGFAKFEKNNNSAVCPVFSNWNAPLRIKVDMTPVYKALE